MSFLKILCALIFLNIAFFSKSQNVVEFQKISFSNTNEYFVKWSLINEYPEIDIYVDSVLILSRDYSDTSILIKSYSKTNVPLFEIKYFDSTRSKGFSYSIPLNDRIPGVIHTTDAVYNIIHPWTSSKLHIMDTFFLANSATDPEVYAFLQEFYEIPDSDMDILIGNKPSYPPVRDVVNIETWKNFLDTLSTSDGGILPDDPCQCKLIQTNSSSLNRPNAQNLNDSETCNLASPVDFGINYESSNDHSDEAIWISQLGAGKGFFYFIQTTEGDDIGTESNPRIRSLKNIAFSRIRYKVVCVNKPTQKPNNECKCKKLVDLEWEYASSYHWTVDNGWHIFGSDNSIILEDWATASLSTTSGGPEILDRGMVSKRGSCDSEPLSSTFTQLTDVATSVKSAIESPTITGIITAAGNTLNFFDAVISLAECNESKDSIALLLSGKRENIELNPGDQLIFSINTGSVLGGHSRNRGKGTTAIGSEGYVVGTLWSTSGESSEACCDDEKIGSFALSSLSEFNFTEITEIERPDRCAISPLNDEVFHRFLPIGGFSSVATTVSSIIGLNGPWGGVFDPSGCCDHVVIDCYSKCGIYRLCGAMPQRVQHTNPFQIQEILGIADEKSEIKNGLFVKNSDQVSEFIHDYERKLFPNPSGTNKQLSIELYDNEGCDAVWIFDSGGIKINLSNWSINGRVLEVEIPENIASGFCVLMFSSGNEVFFSRFIKQ